MPRFKFLHAPLLLQRFSFSLPNLTVREFHLIFSSFVSALPLSPTFIFTFIHILPEVLSLPCRTFLFSCVLHNVLLSWRLTFSSSARSHPFISLYPLSALNAAFNSLLIFAVPGQGSAALLL